ncbi:MAG TPA: zinc ribbon domain-containing protein [Anaerolineales bacterium]|jgi:putative FmdB family regulatory protein
MPIYIYRCENCGVQFERHQSFSDEPLKRCPECSKNSLRKVLTPAGIVFKGSGWYATDHKSASGAGRAARSEGKDSSKPEGAGSSSESAAGSKTEGSSASAGTESSNKTESSSKNESSSKTSE